MNTKISLMNLYDTGAHRGNSKRHINPQLKHYIHGVNPNSLCVIDLVKTIETIEKIVSLMVSLGKKKKQVLVVGTSKYINEYTSILANSFAPAMPFVDYRWLGGQLTNWQTIKKTLKEVEKLETIVNNKDFFADLSRNEQLLKERDLANKNKIFRGIRSLKNNKPGAIIILDAKKNKTAIEEAETNGIPIICFTNLNTEKLPKDLTYTLVFNNTSKNAIELIAKEFVDAYNIGLAEANTVVTETKLTK